jgi:P pilus assembly chaperone PapD
MKRFTLYLAPVLMLLMLISGGCKKDTDSLIGVSESVLIIREDQDSAAVQVWNKSTKKNELVIRATTEDNWMTVTPAEVTSAEAEKRRDSDRLSYDRQEITITVDRAVLGNEDAAGEVTFSSEDTTPVTLKVAVRAPSSTGDDDGDDDDDDDG